MQVKWLARFETWPNCQLTRQQTRDNPLPKRLDRNGKGLGKSGIVISMFLLALYVSGCDQRFDAAKWKAERNLEYEQIEYRPQIAATVIDQIIKVGASRVDIEKALGPPDSTKPTGEVYCLGFPTYGVGLDPEYLILIYDEFGKLVRFHIEQG